MPLRTNTSRFRALGPLLMLASMLLAGMTVPSAHADNLTKLYSFSDRYATGSEPVSKLLQAPDGYFYGTTTAAGAHGCGTIFRMNTRGTVTTLYSFENSITGHEPRGGLVRDTDGAFYGTTNLGGVNYQGVVYKMTIATVGGNPVATVTPYYSFKGSNFISPALSEPGLPDYGELIIGSDSKLYGTSQAGGVYNLGTAYSLGIVGSGFPKLAVLHSFNIAPDAGGSYPLAGVTEGRDGRLYGTTSVGGANGFGTVYSLTRDGGTFTDIHDFTGSPDADGGSPQSQLTRSSAGTFYGTTPSGLYTGGGTLYKISSTGIYSLLYSFDGFAGQGPTWQPILAADGKLYGTTIKGGSGIGTGFCAGVVYRFDLSTNRISTFAEFNGIDGCLPNAITQGTDKNFYGTGEHGGLTSPKPSLAEGKGSAFKISSTGTVSLLYSFHARPGHYPYGTVQGPDGQFYGVTSEGGYFERGTIYKCDASGNITILHHFNQEGQQDGYTPKASLIVGKDGCLYGSTYFGGEFDNSGTIFKVTTDGVFTRLCSLRAPEGANITAPLLEGKDGCLYGVAYHGGIDEYGTLFKVSGGNFILLHCFTYDKMDGGFPQYGLAQDGAGNIFGTTVNGGMLGGGTVFEMNTSTATYKCLCSFGTEAGNPGNSPYSTLLYAGGVMYGTNMYGGANGTGTIFKFTPSVSTFNLTVMHDFKVWPEGSNPVEGLSVGPNGMLYGTTYSGGSDNGGTVYSIDSANNFTTLYKFSIIPLTNASVPKHGVIVGSDNNLYLTTIYNGDFGAGTFDTLDIGLHFAVKVSASVSVTLGTLTLKDGTYHGHLTVTNTGKTTILGPLNVVLTGLTGGTTLVNKTGDVPSGYGASTGKPYIQADPHGSAHGIFALGAGKSVTIPVQFSVGTGVSASSQTYLRRF